MKVVWDTTKERGESWL